MKRANLAAQLAAAERSRSFASRAAGVGAVMACHLLSRPNAPN
jgi:hypothetical protein